ncbi:MAG: hypothetical protein DKINENOH_04394 [bacterium]|nr:hypothetical protein [bacterium]
MKTHWLLTLCLCWLLAFALGNGVLAQDQQELTQPKLPLEQLLNRDGTLDLNREFHGSLDPAGWQMKTGPNGEPRFVPASAAQETVGTVQLMAVPDDENWDDRFCIPGPNSVVRAIAVNGSEVYVGGDFYSTRGIVANRIAKWDGTNWSALGIGMNGSVFAIAVSGSEVYAGGSFTAAGNVAANHIAKWDGASWSALGSGTNDVVLEIVVDGNELYAAGQFSTAGGIRVNYIAKWNGTSWSALGSGVSHYVSTIAVSGSEVYAGGSFWGIAKWDGTSWSTLGSGLTRYVSAIAVSGSEMYAAGYFTLPGEVAAYRIAKWDGTSWLALGSEINGVGTIVLSGSEVYAGGAFTTAGGVPANYIAKWDGTSWSALGSGLGSGEYFRVHAITVSGSEIYVGGNFITAGEVTANYIAKWNGTSWMGLLDASNQYGLNSHVSAIALNGGEVYVGGSFTTAGGVAENRIAKWNGTSWSALGSGMNGTVFVIAASGSEVYAGGYFTTAGGVAANYIAKWDGTSWSPLGDGLNSYVLAIAVSGSEVYAGGGFTTAGGVAANRIAKWDGTNWLALGGGMGGDVRSIAIRGSEVYAGGYFNAAGGVVANHIAKWDGVNWSTLGSGMNYDVYAVAVSGGDLYAGGLFTTAGGRVVNGIAKWDGTSWSALGNGMYGSVTAIATNGSEIYVGGNFITAGEVTVNRIAKWDGTSWSALGSGTNGFVFAITVTGNEVYAGGGFTTAGGKPSSYFGRYVLNTPPTADAGADQQICDGKTIAIGGSPAASGGTPPYAYSWAPATGLDDATAANPIASPTVTTTYKLTVTDANRLTNMDEMTVTVKGTCKRFVFLANKLTLNRTKQHTPAGDLHSNGALTVEKGDPSTYNSNLTAVGKITINKENTINGNVTSPLAISNAGRVSGTITVGPVAVEPLPSKSYGAGGPNKTVPKDGTLALAPGSYGIVTLNGSGTLKLTSGDYFFNELRYPGSTAVIEIDLASGDPVNIHVVSNLQLGKEAAIRLLPNGENDSELVTIFTLQSTAVNIGKEAYFLGTLNAPNATVTLVKNSQLRGSLCAKEIIVENDCLFLHHDSPAALPGPGNLPRPSADDEAATSDQSPVISYQLAQNYPNPFNPSTTIRFSVLEAGVVQLAVYNINGQEVRTLIAGQMDAGRHVMNWDGKDNAGQDVPSGIYLYRLRVNGFVQTRKMTLMR